jgi:hypothetical protein
MRQSFDNKKDQIQNPESGSNPTITGLGVIEASPDVKKLKH